MLVLTPGRELLSVPPKEMLTFTPGRGAPLLTLKETLALFTG
jgi:hypothetical protein